MTATLDLDIGGIKYRVRPMDARIQLHVARKLAGLFGAFTDTDRPLSGMTAALAAMPQDDADYVMNACLVLVDRSLGGDTGWAPIMNPQGAFMYDDLRTDLAAIMQMVVPILEANVKGFLSALPQDLIAKVAARLPGASS